MTLQSKEKMECVSHELNKEPFLQNPKAKTNGVASFLFV